MKLRKLIAAGLLFTCLAGCAAQPSPLPRFTAENAPEADLGPAVPTVNYAEVYRPVLDRLFDCITNGWSGYETLSGEIGVREAVSGIDRVRAAETVGYAIRDLSGDGIPELLIADVEEWDGIVSRGRSIFAVYHCEGKTPKLSFEGWGRNRFSLLDDGTFLNVGSNGAMYSIWSVSRLAEDGKKLNYLDCYFTYALEDRPEELGFFYNQLGTFNLDISEPVDLSADLFWRLEEDYEEKTVPFELTPFSEYANSAEALGSFVRVQWLDDIAVPPDVYTEFIADTNSMQTKVLFSPKGNVQNFKLLSLYFIDVEADDKMVFETSELFSIPHLTAERPLVIGLTFAGTIPNYGITYVNDLGETKSYSINTSGKDGSLILSEI